MAGNSVIVKSVGVASLIEDLEDAADMGEQSTWVVGTNVEYAIHLELGTSRMQPYPFLRPAVEYVMSHKADAIANDAGSVDELVGGIALAIEARAKHYASTGVPPGPDVQTGTLRSSIKAERVS